jgi:hypothetical protein
MRDRLAGHLRCLAGRQGAENVKIAAQPPPAQSCPQLQEPVLH